MPIRQPALLPPASFRCTLLFHPCLWLPFGSVSLGLDFARYLCQTTGHHHKAAGPSPAHNKSLEPTRLRRVRLEGARVWCVFVRVGFHCGSRLAAQLRPLLPDASRPATMRCGFHPLAVRREAPHNQRIQHTSPVTSKLAPGLAADPQRVVLR